MIKHNEVIEVSEAQYRKLITKCGGIIAHRKESGKYYIKVWYIKYLDYVLRILIE